MTNFELENHLIFRSAPQALAERRQILEILRWAAVLSLILLAYLIVGEKLWVEILVWLLAAGLLTLLILVDPGALLKGFASRELRLQENAMELVEASFTRLIFFEHLEQMRMIQGKGEKVLSLELKTMGGRVVLRGYENMELLFAQISERRPQQVLLEVVEAKYNTESLASLSALVFGFALLFMLLILAFSPSLAFLKDLGAVLFFALAALSVYFQPLSPHPLKGDWRSWSAAAALGFLGFLFLL